MAATISHNDPFNYLSTMSLAQSQPLAFHGRGSTYHASWLALEILAANQSLLTLGKFVLRNL